MRWLPLRRRPQPAPGLTADLPLLEDRLRRSVDELMLVREQAAAGGGVVFRGELLVASDRALGLLLDRFKPLGYTPFITRDGDQLAVQALPLAEGRVSSSMRTNVVLFLLTCLSTVVAGSHAFLVFDPIAEPWRLLAGVPFAATLMAILGTHEFGHYFTARHHKAVVSLPYFIPVPPPFLFGTLGAVIRMGSPARDRNSLFDIAVAGPLAGLVVTLPALLVGLQWSTVAALPPGDYLRFGDSLLMRFLIHLQFGAVPEGFDVLVHPVAMAGWVGLFVTALNLFPVGQLDGGRIAYALFGRAHQVVGRLTFAGLLVLGAVTRAPSWIVWALLVLLLIGFRHQPPLDDVTPLSRGRQVLGGVCLVLLVLLIPPVPIQLG
jgi:membrane-associated protease RseP (regulator of RpoE activity)